MTRWAPVLAMAIALAGCGRSAEQRACAAFAASTDVSDYVNQDTGRVERDGRGNVLDPRTGRVALTRAEVDCIIRDAQETIDRANNGGTSP